FGTTPKHRFIENQTPVKGRYFNNLDMAERRKVTVIGTEVEKGLFGEEDPVGKYIDVRGIPYKVIGVFDDKGGENDLKRIYIPLSTAQLAYGGTNQVHFMMYTVGNASVSE